MFPLWLVFVCLPGILFRLWGLLMLEVESTAKWGGGHSDHHPT